MIGGIGAYGIGAYRGYAAYQAHWSAQNSASRGGMALRTSVPAAQPGRPVEAVEPVRAAGEVTQSTPLNRADLMLRLRTDPASGQERGGVQLPGGGASAARSLRDNGSGQTARLLFDGPANGGMQLGAGRPLTGPEEAPTYVLPGQKTAAQTGGDPRVMDLGGKTPEQLMDALMGVEEGGTGEIKSAQEVMEEGECQTCKERKYQDGSDDPGVSFKTAAHIDPMSAQSVVRGHENEHVVREQAEARREGREVVSQSVTLHTAICPECGRVYTSGGTTRTVTAAAQEQPKQDTPAVSQEKK